MFFKNTRPWLGFAVLGCGLGLGGTVAAQGIPPACLSIDITPYSSTQALDISLSSHETAHFEVEIADSDATREQGLMCRPALSENQGMLFEFQNIAERTFWMENTLIGLDIIYIAPDGRIVSIQKKARALDRTPLPSNGVASGVLEIAAGESEKLGLKPGDKIIHPFFH